MAPKFRLGKGLDALLPPEQPENFFTNAPNGSADSPDKADTMENRIAFLPLNVLQANPNQPRKNFDEDKLRELADSIRQHGIIDPLIVEAEEGGRYTIIGGERRYRAAALAGLTEVPALIRRFSEVERMEVALIENIQRSDLNPVEEALAYRQLMELTGLSQDEVAGRVGKNRSTVANTLRLLKLPPLMLEALEQAALSPGHGRALLSVSNQADQEGLFREILDQGLSVREAEKRAVELNQSDYMADQAVPSEPTPVLKEPPPLTQSDTAGAEKKRKAQSSAPAPSPKREAELIAIEQRFIDTLGTKVAIQGDLTRGSIRIDYYSMEDLERLLEICSK